MRCMLHAYYFFVSHGQKIRNVNFIYLTVILKVYSFEQKKFFVIISVSFKIFYIHFFTCNSNAINDRKTIKKLISKKIMRH